MRAVQLTHPARVLLLALTACGSPAPIAAPPGMTPPTSAPAPSAAPGAPSADAPASAKTSPPVAPSPPPLPAPATAAEAMAAARAEFEPASRDLAMGTSKVYSRSDLLPMDDRRGSSTGDFVGRLRALFGEAPDDMYVLRHRATGIVIAAYSAQSGPSYGGPLPLEDDQAREARLAALRAIPNPRHALTKPFEAMSAAELLAYRRADRVYMRAVMDARVAPEVARVIQRFDAILSAVPPADWSVTRYWGEDPTVYVEGVENGEAFSRAMLPLDGLAYLLDRAEHQQGGLLDASQGPDAPDLQLFAYWGYHMQLLQSASVRPQLERSRSRVQRAWLRFVERAHRATPETRKYLLALAENHVPPLGLDPAKAAAAMRRPAAP